MISLIKFFVNLIKKLPFIKGLFKDEIKIILRLPPALALRANILGISIGLFFVLGITFFQLSDVYNLSPARWYEPFVLTLLFMAGPYLLGGFFPILLLGVALLLKYLSLPAVDILDSARILVQWNLIGYGFGATFALLYNDLVFIYLVFIEKKYKIAFAYKPGDKINIIKSPYEREEKALLDTMKPIMYYTSKIEEGIADRQKNADKITEYIELAYKQMEYAEKLELVQAMKADPSYEPIPVATDMDSPFKAKSIKLYSDFKTELNTVNSKLIDDDSKIRKEAIQLVEHKIEPLVELKLKLKEHKLYNFELGEAPPYPYTILFVANPYIRKRRESEASSYKHEKDLIMKFSDLFYHSVDLALRSLENDEVVGSPEIWSRIRVVTIFDDDVTKTCKQDFALLEEFQDELVIGSDIPENLLDPMQEMNQRVETMLTNHFKVYIETNGNLTKPKQEKTQLTLKHIDVIFGMSGWLTHDRATAHFTDYDEIAGRKDALADKGERFQFVPDPQKTKQDNLNKFVINIEKTFDNVGGSYNHKPFCHEYYASSPGRVALNIFSADKRTIIHEFAHAMSSFINGAITDEYADIFELRSPNSGGKSNDAPPFYVNRIERKKQGNGRFVPVHKIFADYDKVVFHSDLDHPSIRENWLGYFPERQSPLISCIMDRYTGLDQFDKLISNFMYDRLVSKLNRDK